MSENTPVTKSKGSTLIILLCIVLVAAIVFGVVTYLDRNELSAQNDELTTSLESANAEIDVEKSLHRRSRAGAGGSRAGAGGFKRK